MERDLLSSLEDSLPIVETRFGIEIRNNTDIFKVKVNDNTYYSDIVDCLSDAELINNVITTYLQKIWKLVSLAKKSIRDLYVSRDEIVGTSNNSLYVVIGFTILVCQLATLFVFMLYVGLAITY